MRWQLMSLPVLVSVLQSLVLVLEHGALGHSPDPRADSDA
jgi:hypothetical protein